VGPDSMRRAISETNRRRELQLAFNEEHGITPRSIVKSLDQVMAQTAVADSRPRIEPKVHVPVVRGKDLEATIRELERLMLEAAKDLEFEKAAAIRDEIADLKKQAGNGK